MCAGGELVLEPDPHGPVLLRDDGATEVAIPAELRRVGIPPQLRGWQTRVQLIHELPDRDLVVVVTGGCAGSGGYRNGSRHLAQPSQRGDELLHSRGLRESGVDALPRQERRSTRHRSELDEVTSLHRGALRHLWVDDTAAEMWEATVSEASCSD